MNDTLRVAGTLRDLEAVRRFVERRAQAAGLGPDAVHGVVLAVDELVTNIILHGYGGGPGAVEIQARVERGALVVRLRDRAPAFDPTLVPTPDITLPLELRPVGGMGIHLARSFTDELRHRALPRGGNELTVVKRAR